MKTNRLTRLGLLTAAAVILGYLEYLLPVFPALPGVKLGLGNVAILYALYAMDQKSALLLTLLKVLLCGLLFANAAATLYALAGGLCGLLSMTLSRRLRGVSVAGVSVAGALFHNLGQAGLACLLLGRAAVLCYLPVLLLSAVITGLLTGVAAKGVLAALPGGGKGDA